MLECTVANCKLGPGDTVWKTPSLPAIAAISLLDSHSDNHKQLVDKITVDDQDTMELTCMECTLPNCKSRGLAKFPLWWPTPFMRHEDAVLALKHHELTYHTVPDTMLEEERVPVESKHSEEERENSQEERLGMISTSVLKVLDSSNQLWTANLFV